MSGSRPEFTYINPCIKYTLFFFNFMFWIIGGVIFAIGTWSFLEEYKYMGLPEVENIYDFIIRISVVIMVFGGIVFVMSFAGCLGALRENVCLLNCYSYCLLILFLGEVVLVVVAFVFPNKLLGPLKKSLSNEPIIKYRDDANLQNLIDTIQKEFKCCGMSDQGYKDWSKNVYFNCSPSNPSRERCGVPYSCCKNPRNLESNLINYMCGFDVRSSESVTKSTDTIFVGGCINAFQDYLNKNVYLVAGVLIGVALLQMFATYLCRTLLAQIEAQLSLWR